MEKTGLILDSNTISGIARLAGDAEAAGFDSVWATELYRTSFGQLAAAALHTSTVKLGTAVALAFTRTPLLMALTAFDIDEISGGRLVLGLGSGAKRTNELWHGISHGKPVKRISEYIELLRLMFEGVHRGEAVTYKGEYYDVDLKGYHRAFEPARTDIPIFLAGVGKNMTKAAGAVADGYIGHVVCSLKYLKEVVCPSIKSGLEVSGRDRGDFTLSSIITCAPSKDRKRAEDAARRTIAFYATVKTYAPPFKLHGFEREAALIREAFFKEDLDSMIKNVSDEMVRAFAVVGDVDQCRRRVQEYRRYVDLPILSAPHYYLDFDEVGEYQKAILEIFGR
ncbi:MAG: LLM class flavin-dependent oxidoreductase [Thermodesulfobacteriota bacterium]